MPGPHDLLVRYTFGAPERAEAELRAALPSHVVAAVDWSSLRQEPGSVVDDELRETETDLLFSARLRAGGTLLVYVLLEHQSSVDRYMALRMLRYVVRQLERWSQEHPEGGGLPVIIPLVMYHGAGGAWTAPTRVEDLFEVPEAERARWHSLVPRFEFLLDDLTAKKAEALMARPGPPLVRLAWLALRYGRTEELAERMPEWVALFAEVYAGPDGTENLGVILRYLLHVGGGTTSRVAKQVLDSVVDAQHSEELMRTLGEALIERGRRRGLRQGLEQGRLQERAETVLRILAARSVWVGEEGRQRILACTDGALLNRWVERAVSATCLADVLDEPAQ